MTTGMADFTQVNDLKSVYKVEGADLAVIKRKLEGEMVCTTLFCALNI